MEQQDEEIKELTRLLNLVWGSEELAYERLNRLRDSYNCDLFNAMLSLVQVAFVPESFFTDLLGNRTSAGSRYEPASTYMEATICLGPRVLESTELAPIVLLHEMIHHWELTLAQDLYLFEYPSTVDVLIDRIFSDPIRARKWRATHSKRFLAKAHEISTKREIDLATLLYGHMHLRR